jgi:hypothetical protein
VPRLSIAGVRRRLLFEPVVGVEESMKVGIGVALLSLVLAGSAAAQEHQTPNTLKAPGDSPGPAATLADVSWLVGHWKGTGLGGVSEEIWSQPAGGVMMGMYRLVIDGKPSFYEFIHLAEENGSVSMRLKHFNADLTGWEEKDRVVTFRLVKLGVNEAYFGGLTFRRSENRLQIFLAIRDRDGKVREESFTLERQQ